jgi:hypothetical protein
VLVLLPVWLLLLLLLMLLLLLHHAGALERWRTDAGGVTSREHGGWRASGRRSLKAIVSEDVRDWRKTIGCLCGRNMVNMARLAKTTRLMSMWAQACERMVQWSGLNDAFV